MAGCGGKLSKEFDETEVKEAAEEMINLINAGELSKVYENSFTPVLTNSVKLEELQETVDYVLDKMGEFQSFEKIQIKGIKDKNTGTPYATVLTNSVKLEELQETVDYVLDKMGEFQSFEKIQIKGIKDKNTGTPYATAVVLAKYEEGNAMFTISFDTDMMCAGFFIK